jgi:hypothetical protein
VSHPGSPRTEIVGALTAALVADIERVGLTVFQDIQAVYGTAEDANWNADKEYALRISLL